MVRKKLADYADGDASTLSMEGIDIRREDIGALKKHLVKPSGTLTLSNTGKMLLDQIERIERLVDDQKALAEDISEIKKELKSNGFDMKAVGDLIKLRAMGESEAMERLQTIKFYAESVGVNVWPD